MRALTRPFFAVWSNAHPGGISRPIGIAGRQVTLG
jgi:hypothetical protein